MRKLSAIILLFTALESSFSLAQSTPEFDKQSFMKEGLNLVTEVLQDKLKDSGLASDTTCPASGMDLLENLNEKKAKIFSAVDSVHDLMESIKPKVEEKRSDKSRCGSCQQTNVVSYYASISPEKTLPIPECGGLKPQTFTTSLSSKDEIKDFTEQILKGENSEGQRLQKGCPDPCAYYVTTAETSLPNGKTHLTLTVQCGQPRKDSIFSSVYEYKAGLVHQWTCSR